MFPHKGDSLITAIAVCVGGEALVAADTSAIRAAREAATGVWLSDYEAGRQHQIPPPGLTHGLFGAWSNEQTGPLDSSGAEELLTMHHDLQQQPLLLSRGRNHRVLGM